MEKQRTIPIFPDLISTNIVTSFIFLLLSKRTETFYKNGIFLLFKNNFQALPQ